MRKRILAVVSILLCALEVYCANNLIDEVLMTNGTKLRGVISVQLVKEQKITVTSYESEIILPTYQINKRKNYKVSVNKLPNSWRRWLKEHPEYAAKSDSIVLSSISLRARNIAGMMLPDQLDSVFVIPGTTDIKIQTFSRYEIEASLSSVKMMNKIYINRISSKIKEIIETRDNKLYAGRTLSQIPGKYISFMSDEGVVSVNYSDIKSIKYELSNDAASLNDAIEYEETVETLSGQRYDGIIIRKVYGNQNTSSYVILRCKNQTEQSIQNKDIRVIYKKIKETGWVRNTSKDESYTQNTSGTVYSSYEEAVSASKDEANKEDNATSVEVNGVSCKVEKIQVKGNRYILLMRNNVVTFQASDFDGKICISRAGGDLIRCEGGKMNEYTIKMSEISGRRIETSNSFTIGQDDFMPEYNIAPGMYAYIMDGSECIFIDIQ